MSLAVWFLREQCRSCRGGMGCRLTRCMPCVVVVAHINTNERKKCRLLKHRVEVTLAHTTAKECHPGGCTKPMVKPFQPFLPAVTVSQCYSKMVPLRHPMVNLKPETVQALCRGHIGAPPPPKSVIPARPFNQQVWNFTHTITEKRTIRLLLIPTLIMCTTMAMTVLNGGPRGGPRRT